MATIAAVTGIVAATAAAVQAVAQQAVVRQPAVAFFDPAYWDTLNGIRSENLEIFDFLNEAVQFLGSLRKDFQIEIGKNKMRVPSRKYMEWVDRVMEIEDRVKDLKAQYYKQGEEGTSIFWSFFPYTDFREEMKMMRKKVINLLQESNEIKYKMLVDRAPEFIIERKGPDIKRYETLRNPQDDEELCSTEGLGNATSKMSKEEDRGIEEDIGGVDGEIVGELDIGRVLVRDDSVGLESCPDTSNDVKDEESSNAMTREPLYSISPNGEFKRSIKCWQKGGFLGRGAFGTVYKGFTDEGFFFAVKEVSMLDQGSEGEQSIFQLEQEITLLSQFEHENIVQYLGTDKDDSKLYIFLELVTEGSLANLYQKYQLQDSQVSAYTRQILNALNYLHCRKVVHRDIKCANILVDASGSVKLADFGLAKATKLNDIKSSKGTAFWMAPEMLLLG